MFSVTTAERIAVLKRRTRWTNEELARRLGVSVGAVASLGQGRRLEPSRKTLARLEELEREPTTPPALEVALQQHIDKRFGEIALQLAEIRGILLGKRTGR